MLNRLNKQNYYVSGYLLVFLSVLLSYMLLSIYPFGDSYILKIDLFHQYAPVIMHLRDAVFSGNSIFYSWNGALGVDFLLNLISLAASPFTVFVVFFKPEFITEFFSLLIIVKIPFAAVTFTYYIKKRFNHYDALTLCFSCCYALMGFVLAYYWNIMWLDAVILLPLVAAGIHNIQRKKGYLLYTISLFLAICTNYLMGYFICAFSVLYYLFLHIQQDGNIFKNFGATAIDFTKGSLFAGALAAIVLVPVFLSLQHSEYLDESFPSTVSFYFPILKYLAGHFAGTTPAVLVKNADIPNVYSGVLSFILLPLYFLAKNIKLKEKATMLVILTILFLGFDVNVLDFIFHGFHYTSNLPHRFVFIYSFFLIAIGYEAFINVNSIKTRWIFLFYGAFSALAVVCYIFYPQTTFNTNGRLSLFTLIVNLVLLLIYFLVLFLHNKNYQYKQFLSLPLLIVLFLELSLSTYTSLLHYHVTETRYLFVQELYNNVQLVKKELPSQDFYRMELSPNRTLSDGLVFNYKGITMFAFTNKKLTTLLRSFGVAAGTNSVFFQSATPLVNSLLGFKYSLNRGFMSDAPPIYFEKYKKIENITVYENPTALPLGFMVDESIKNFLGTKNNPFEVQNEFARLAAGSADIFEADNAFYGYNYNHLTLSEMGNVIEYTIDDDVLNYIEPTITTYFNVSKTGQTFIHVAGGGVKTAKVYLGTDEVFSQLFNNAGVSTLDAGFLQKGQMVKVELILNAKRGDGDEQFVNSGKIELNTANMNIEESRKTLEKLSRQPLQIESYSEVEVVGNITAQQNGVMLTTIPYDSRWSVKIDGVETKTFAAMDGFVAVDIQKGAHKVEISYQNNSIYIGAIVSVLAILLLIYDNKKRKTQGDGSPVL